MAHCAGELTAVDAAKAKWWSAQVQNEILDACVQLYGGYGYMNEYRVARAWRDARVTKIWAGSNEIMKEIIGRDLGSRSPEPLAGLDRVGDRVARWGQRALPLVVVPAGRVIGEVQVDDDPAR